MIVSNAFLHERKRLQRRSVRYAFLAFLLMILLLFSTGCSLLLDGKELDAYQCITASSRFEGAKSVRMLSGRMYGGDLYGFIAYTSRQGHYECEMYRISSSGYTKLISITLYSLDDAERCLAEGYLDIDQINSTLEIYYGSPLSGLSKLAKGSFGGGNHMFWMIIIIIVVLCLIGFLSSKASDIAQDKGYDKKTWFHMCFWLGPISFILIAAMPDLKLRTKQDETISQLKQLIEQAKNDKTSSLLSELVDYTKANQAAQAAQTIQPVQAAPSQETHTSSAQTTMRRRGPVAPISQED